MNVGKNENLSLKNCRTLATYLYVNKNRFYPNNKKSYNLYLDRKTIQDELGWSSGKLQNVKNECLNRNILRLANSAYSNFGDNHFSQLYNINLIILSNYLDKKIIATEAERFIQTSLKTKSNAFPLYNHFPRNNVSFFENAEYAKRHYKSVDDINTNIKHFLVSNKIIELFKPIETELVNEINTTNRSPCEQIVFNEKMTIKKTAKRFSVKKSCRATSKYCNSESETLRPEINKLLNLPYQYDISCAVPNMFYLLNKQVSDFSNIRQMLIDNLNLNNVINEKQLKPLTYRLLFSTSFIEMETKINRLIQIHNSKADPINDDDINTFLVLLPYLKLLYDEIHNIIGDSSIRSKIFMYESILELRTVLALRKNGFYTSNVYDCFYSEADPDTIKNELKKQAVILYNDFPML